MKKITISLSSHYSLDKSLNCLKKMGKLFPIEYLEFGKCRLLLQCKQLTLICTIVQIQGSIIVTVDKEVEIETLTFVRDYVVDKFNLNSNLYTVDVLEQNDFMLPIVEQLNGLRLIKEYTVLMCLVRTIISQQISLKVADKKFRDFLMRYGNREFYEGNYYYSFPDDELLQAISVDGLIEIGLPKMRAAAIVEAIKISEEINFENLSFSELGNILLKVKGIGSWTVEMIGLFYFSNSESVPLADLGLHRAIEKLYGLSNRSISKMNMKEVSDTWKGNKSIVVYYLWEYLMLNHS